MPPAAVTMVICQGSPTRAVKGSYWRHALGVRVPACPRPHKPGLQRVADGVVPGVLLQRSEASDPCAKGVAHLLQVRVGVALLGCHSWRPLGAGCGCMTLVCNRRWRLFAHTLTASAWIPFSYPRRGRKGKAAPALSCRLGLGPQSPACRQLANDDPATDAMWRHFPPLDLAAKLLNALAHATQAKAVRPGVRVAAHAVI